MRMVELGGGMRSDADAALAQLVKYAKPVGAKVEIVPHQKDSTWPGGVGTIVEICPKQGGYMVEHEIHGRVQKHGWCWDEVKLARPWWKRLLSKHPKRED